MAHVRLCPKLEGEILPQLSKLVVMDTGIDYRYLFSHDSSLHVLECVIAA